MSASVSGLDPQEFDLTDLRLAWYVLEVGSLGEVYGDVLSNLSGLFCWDIQRNKNM